MRIKRPFSAWRIVTANMARFKRVAGGPKGLRSSQACPLFKAKSGNDASALNDATANTGLVTGFLSDLVPPLIFAIACFATLVYQLHFNTVTSSDQSIHSSITAGFQYIAPTVWLAANAIVPLGLLFLVPLFKDLAIWLEALILRKTRSKPVYRVITTSQVVTEWFVDKVLSSTVLLFAVFSRTRFVDVFSRYRGLVAIWMLEVTSRRHRRDLSPASVSLILLTITLNLAKVAHNRPLVGPLDRLMGHAWQALGLEMPSQDPMLPGGLNLSFWPNLLTFTIAFCVVSAASHVFERILAYHVEVNRPAKIRMAEISLESDLLWFLATVTKTIIWWLYRTTSLVSIAICILQFYLFGQVRTLIPTVIFAMVEIGGVLIGETRARIAESGLNSRPVTVSTHGPYDTTETRTIEWENLQVGDTVILSPGSEAAGTVLFISAVNCESGVMPPRPSIETVSIDGETAERVKQCLNDYQAPEIRRHVAEAVENGQNAGLAVAELLGLNRYGHAGSIGADRHLAQHPLIARQGARLRHTSVSPFTALIIGFTRSQRSNPTGDIVDAFLQRLSKTHTYLLAFYTLTSLVVAYLISGVNLASNPRIVVEIALSNNVCLLMTLVSIIGTVLELLTTPIPGLTFGLPGKRALVTVSESLARAKQQFGPDSIVGVHLSDKTGTITSNQMSLETTVTGGHAAGGHAKGGHAAPLDPPEGGHAAPLDPPEGGHAAPLDPPATSKSGRGSDMLPPLKIGRGVMGGCNPPCRGVMGGCTPPCRGVMGGCNPPFIDPKLETRENRRLAQLHVSVTSNTAELPNVVPEEAAYSRGLGVELSSRVTLDGPWEQVEYSWHGQPQPPITRMLLGLSYQYKAVTSVVKGPSLDIPRDSYGIVFQGAPESTLLKPSDSSQFPPLDVTARECSESGAQRNWVLAISQQVISPEQLHELQQAAAELMVNPDHVEAGQTRDRILGELEFTPIRMMVLVDRYRTGVERVPVACAQRKMSFWMITGDGLANASAIADAIGLPQTHLSPPLFRDDDAKGFAQRLASILNHYQTPVTLLLGAGEQAALTGLSLDSLPPKLLTAFRRLDRNRQPIVSVVAYSSERNLKRKLVEFCRHALGVATVFTGDGKNDIDALTAADLGVAFPSISSADGNVNHDPEVYLAGTVRTDVGFWTGYSGPRCLLLNWGSVLWSQLHLATVLLILKQSGTAGINVAAAYRTGFTDNGDPYHPSYYLFMSNVVAFAVIVMCSVLSINTRARREVTRGITRLAIVPYLVWSLLSWLLGMMLFGIATCLAPPGFCADSALTLLVMLIAAVGIGLPRAT